ncbi:MAG: oligosaccharide flippase family protein [Lachnospiraceae bacterium]|nr:oligosaccharide flippase family protein [Lachnospiraceae bacterium]
MSNNKKALKAGFWYTVGNFVAKSMVFLTSPIFNRLMSKSEVGDFSNYSVWVTILAIVFTLDLYSAVSVARFDYKDELDDFIGSSLILGSSITLFFYFLAIIFANPITKWMGINKLELHIAFAYFLVCPALQMYQLKSRIQYKYIASTVVTLLSTIFATAGSLVAIIILEDNLLGRIAGNYIPLVLFNIAIYIMLMTKARKISTKYWKYALAIAIPLAIHLLAGNILNLSDKIMIQNIRGNEENGLYSVAYSCGIVITVLWGSINGAWSPWAYEQMDANNLKELRKAEKVLMILWGVLVVGMMLLGPEILLIIGGKKYMEARNVIPPVMTAYGIQAVYTFYNNIEVYSKKQRYIAINTTLAAITNIVLNYIFINKYGYIAAAYTTLVGYILMLILHMAVVIKIGRGNWYDSKFNVLFSLTLIVNMFIIILLYRFPIARYALIAILAVAFLIVAIIYRRVLTEVLKTRSIRPLKEKFLSSKNGKVNDND